MGSVYSPVFDFKPSYMLANPNLINGKVSWLFGQEKCNLYSLNGVN